MVLKGAGTLGNKDMSAKKMEGQDYLHQRENQAEISCRIMLSQVRNGQKVEITATEQQCRNLCRRLGIPAVKTVTCLFTLERISTDIVRASGHLVAQVSQTCIITNDLVEEMIDEYFILRFVPQNQILADADGHAEALAEALDWESLLVEEEDDIAHDGQMIDLGEAVCEQLALCLDPWPRKIGSGLELFVEQAPDDGASAGGLSDPAGSQGKGKRNPFSVLAVLKSDCEKPGSEEKDKTKN